MLKIGLTGNIGSGKSTACRIFATLGVPIFYADQEAKELYKENGIKSKVKELFREGVFNPANEVDSPYSIHESAIIFEYGQEKYFDKIICVTAPLDLRIQRTQERDNSGIDQIKERVNNQMQEKVKERLSDFVVVNDGSSFLIPQIMDIHRELSS